MSTYNDHIGKPSKLHINHSGESYKQQFPKRNKPKTVCLQPDCGHETTNEHGYCPRHARVCKKPGCGNRISYNSNRCRTCSIIDSQENRTAAIRKAMAGKPAKPLTQKEELLDIIAQAEAAKVRGRFPRVCDGIIEQNRTILEKMERADYVRTKIGI